MLASVEVPCRGDRAAARAALAVRAALVHPHLLPVSSMSAGPDGFVVVHDLPDARASAPLAVRGGSLSLGEVVTLGCALADALDALHAAGVVHGGVDVAAVTVLPSGRPALLGGGAAPSDEACAADVRALVALCRTLARDPAEVDAAVGDLSPLAASARAAEVARRLFAAAPARPLVRPGRGPAPTAGRSHRRPVRNRRRLLPLLGVVLVVAGGVLGAAALAADAVRGGGPRALPAPPAPSASAPTTGPTTAPTSAPTSAPTPMPTSAGARTPADGWRAVLEGLDRARSTAFARSDPRLLARVYLPGPAAARDAAALADLHSRGLRVSPPSLVLRSVTVVGRNAGEVRLAVVDERSPYRLLSSDGRGTIVAGRGPLRWLVRLRPTLGGQWRVYDVTRAQPGATVRPAR